MPISAEESRAGWCTHGPSVQISHTVQKSREIKMTKSSPTVLSGRQVLTVTIGRQAGGWPSSHCGSWNVKMVDGKPTQPRDSVFAASQVDCVCSMLTLPSDRRMPGAGWLSQRHLYAASDTQSVLGLTSLGLGHVGHQYFGHLPSSLTPPPHSLASWSNLSRSLRSPGMCNKILQIPENSELTRPRLLPC